MDSGHFFGSCSMNLSQYKSLGNSRVHPAAENCCRQVSEDGAEAVLCLVAPGVLISAVALQAQVAQCCPVL